jgi:hypothetical protein
MALTFDLVILAQNLSSFEMHINYAMLTIMNFGCTQINLELELLYTMFCLLLVLFSFSIVCCIDEVFVCFFYCFAGISKASQRTINLMLIIML